MINCCGFSPTLVCISTETEDCKIILQATYTYFPTLRRIYDFFANWLANNQVSYYGDEAFAELAPGTMCDIKVIYDPYHSDNRIYPSKAQDIVLRLMFNFVLLSLPKTMAKEDNMTTILITKITNSN